MDDLRVLATTWNMGGAKLPDFERDLRQKMFACVQEFDLVFFSAQECIRSQRFNRIVQLEAYMGEQGFVNIDEKDDHVSQYEMFLICFVKKRLMKHVSMVK